jgi:hypothetical protein
VESLVVLLRTPHPGLRNPVERRLSRRVFAAGTAIVDACAGARNDLLAEMGRLAGLTAHPDLERVRTS